MEEDVGLAKKYYNKLVPVNIRTFVETAFGSTEPITEKDFTPEDLEYLQKMYESKKAYNAQEEARLKNISKNLKPGEWLSKELQNGVLVDTTSDTLKKIDDKIQSYAKDRSKTSLSYEDYPESDDTVYESDSWGKQIQGSFSDPNYRLHTTLGRFNVIEQPNGDSVIQDTYDWTKAKVTTADAVTGLAGALASPEKLGNGFMRIFKPETSRQVTIKLPKRKDD